MKDHQERKIRILIAKLGLDGHDRGIKIIGRAYRDAGFEVIYSGLHQTPEEVVQAAIQEDVDMIGLSSLAGAHMYLFSRVAELLKKNEVDDIVICAGGIIPKEDIPKLEKIGVKGVFVPGSALGDIVKWVKEHVKPRELSYQ